jgi:uncharacterized damage-inducible protein DinB
MSDSLFLADALGELAKYKRMAEAAFAQISDKQWFVTTDDEANSVAIIVKHMVGNMRSRWTDFLTTDGEKPNRARDTEFEIYAADTVPQLKARWEEGWKLVFDALTPLSEKDLTRVVPIRGQPHTVMQAVMRQLTHYAYHVGQIVFLGRQMVGKQWKSLSIPRNKSKDVDVARDGSRVKLPAQPVPKKGKR